MHTRNERREGRKLLEEMLPKVRELMAKGGHEVVLNSEVAKVQARYTFEDNLDYAHVYRAEYGGYIADIWLKQVPPGVAKGFGTPVARPHPTREEAIESLVTLIACSLKAHEQVKGQAMPRLFEFFDVAVELDDDLLAEMEKRGGPFRTQRDALEALDRLAERIAPGRTPTLEDIQAVPDGRESVVVLVALCGAAMHGVFRYPTPVAHPVGRFPPSIKAPKLNTKVPKENEA